MAKSVSFKAVALLALVGAVVLFCDANPTKKPTYTPSPIVKVGRQLLGQPSYTYTIKYMSPDPNSVETIFGQIGIRFIRISRARGSVTVNILNEDHDTFKNLKASKKSEWTVTSEEPKKTKHKVK